jgi:hypothetical protein
MSAQVLDKMRVVKEAQRLEQMRCSVMQPGEKRLASFLVKLRSACRHADRVIELYLLESRGPVTEEVIRFCLRCGEMESRSAKLSVPSGLPQFKVIRRAKKILRTECDWTLFRMLVANYRERLYEKALFDEYDSEGDWRGWSGGIVRGRIQHD